MARAFLPVEIWWWGEREKEREEVEKKIF